mmetsp:Transcript_129337/g.306875  ORF Transcript_129337/g.306875 Transcript_129337/m.306875 type:complete len:95 (+) Transcript_129337:94-378(+)
MLCLVVLATGIHLLTATSEARGEEGLDFEGIDFDEDFASGTLLGLQRGFEVHRKTTGKEPERPTHVDHAAEDVEALLGDSGDKRRAAIVRSEPG